MKNHIRSFAVACIVGFGALMLSGCGGVTEEQLAQLEAKKKEVKSLEMQANGLREEKARLEKEIADKEKKLVECNKLKQETQANLQKIQK